MNLTLNGRFLTQPLTGVQRHALEVARALRELAAERGEPGPLLQLPAGALAQPDALRLAEPDAVTGRLRGQLWEQFELPLRARRGRLWNLCNTYPLTARAPLVVVHDASVYAAPDGYTPNFIRWYRFLFERLARRRDAIVVTDSEFSRGELARHAGFDPARLHVVPCGVDHWRHVAARPAVLDRLGLRGQPFVLAVASDNPNKNLARLVQAFLGLAADRPGLRLVLVGGGNARVFASGTAVDDPRVLRTGRIDDGELAALYGAATVFAFPSLYEGFGLPPLEAMAHGCPVAVSDAASLPEVCGEAALYFDGRDVPAIAVSLARLLDDATLRDNLARAGRLRAAGYTWRRTATALLALDAAAR